jgi:hypothetical protein
MTDIKITPYEPVGWEAARRARARRFFPALLVFAGVVAIGLFGFGPTAACACDPTPPPPPVSPVEGVVIAVDSAGLGQVSSFVLRFADASTLTLTMGQLENATEFSPSHLNEHMASSEPVRAFFRLENGLPVVYRLEDATT